MGYDPYKQVWFNPSIEYIFDTVIYEYDIRDAGFSIIKEYDLLPHQKIIELELLGKGLERHITIGKLQGQNKEFSKNLSNKFAEIRAVFIGANQLTDDEIVSVKKDAIFTINACGVTDFGTIHFIEKNMYSSYIRFSNIGNVEIYYSNTSMDIKGLGESSTNRHRLYLLDFIKQIIVMIENKDPRVKRTMMEFVRKYKARELDDEYYLKFDRASKDIDLLFNYQNVIIPLIQIIQKEIPT